MKIYLGRQAVFSRRDKLKVFFRWFFYALLMVFLYAVMCGGFFDKWQPILIIPLATAVAMRESEVSGTLFGLVCGLMVDTACGYLFGMSSFWLMPMCLGISLLVMNLIRQSFINHIWLTLIVCTVMASMDYFFNYMIWGLPNNQIVFREYILPSYLSAVILSPAVFIAVKFINKRFMPKDKDELEGSSFE